MMVSFENFKALDMRIAKITGCEEHPNADKLYVLTVDSGSDPKKIVAGIRLHYKKEELLGKEVVVVNNLEPASIRGVESHGMVLAAHDGERIVFLKPEREVAAGSKIS